MILKVNLEKLVIQSTEILHDKPPLLRFVGYSQDSKIPILDRPYFKNLAKTNSRFYVFGTNFHDNF